MKKKGFSEDIGKGIKGMMEYISDDEVKQAKELIIKAISDNNNLSKRDFLEKN